MRPIGRGQLFLLSLSAAFMVFANCLGPVLGTLFVVFGASGACYVLCARLIGCLGVLPKEHQMNVSDTREARALAREEERMGVGFARISVFALSAGGSVCLMLAIAFHVIALLHDRTRVTTPLVVTMTGFVLVWLRMNVTGNLLKIRPFIGRIRSDDDRLSKGQRFLLLSLVLGMLGGLGIFMTAGDHNAFSSVTPWPLVSVLCMSASLACDIAAICVNRQFLDGFHPVEGHQTKGDED